MAASSKTRGRTTISKVLSVSDIGRPEQDAYNHDEHGSTPSSSPHSSRNVLPSDECDVPIAQANVAGFALTDSCAMESAAAPPADELDFNFWFDMNATLDACFDTSIKVSDSERPLDILSDISISEAPRVIQMFLSHGDACTKIEGEALELVSNGATARGKEEPLKPYNDMLDYLELLQEKAGLLETAISRLAYQAEEQKSTSEEAGKDGESLKAAADANLRRVFAACLSVLRARKENLTVAQDLVDSAQENVSISLRMEDLDIE